MNLIFANPQTFAPFQHATWEKTRPDAWELVHRGTLFVGEPGKPLGKLIELRLTAGTWARDPIVSGGNLTNRTDKSVFITVSDHMNATEFFVDLTGLRGPDRVGTPIQMEVYTTTAGVLEDPVLERTITLGYIGGVDTSVVPFFNPPTNPRQQTTIVLNNHENPNHIRVLAVDADGVVHHGSLGYLAPGRQAVLEAGAVYAAVKAEPVAGNKLRLIVCSSAPLTVVSKVRDSDSGIMCDNAVRVLA
jgi:hypothetical protein